MLLKGLSMSELLTNCFKASFPAIAIQTSEETRALGDVISAAKAAKRDVYTWSATEGVAKVGESPIEDTQDLEAACKMFRKERSVFILLDPHTWPFDRSPPMIRALKDLLMWGPTKGSSVVILSPECKPHPTIEKMVTIMEYDLPSPDDLRRVSEGIIASTKAKIAPASDEVIRALSGLSTSEAENALTLSLIETKSFDQRVIYREKIKSVKRTGLLDIIDPDPRGLAAIGGLDALKAWISKRTKIWSPEAKAYGLSPPKGVMLVGLPGTGKSLCTKAIGTSLGIPTLLLDMGSMFNSLIGESQARIRDALKLATALAPIVLVLDEIDKGLAGSTGSGESDGGTTKKVLGTLLTWMQNRTAPVFLVVTANDVTNLPPEFLRKGRFDEIWAVDLPDAKARAEILAIHIKGKGRDPRKFDLEAIAKATETFVGSELEAVLEGAMHTAFDEGREVLTTDLLVEAKVTIPLATTAKEQVENLRNWAQKRARDASGSRNNSASSSVTLGQRSI